MTGALRQYIYGPSERTDESSRKKKKIQLSDEEIANLSDAEFKTLVIRMLTEMIELGRKIKEEMKVIQSEIKENIQGTNSDWKETGIQINSLHQKEEINSQPEQNEETRIQKKKKMRRGSGASGTTFKVPTSKS